jgi:hypothetical protein
MKSAVRSNDGLSLFIEKRANLSPSHPSTVVYTVLQLLSPFVLLLIGGTLAAMRWRKCRSGDVLGTRTRDRDVPDSSTKGGDVYLA